MTSPAQGPSAGLSAFLVSGNAGAVIYSAGDTSTDLYVVQRGQIELVDERRGGRRLALLELGDFFGERALFERQPRDHTARAVTAFAIVRLDWPTFQAIVQHRPDIALNMLRIVSRRINYEPPHVVEHPAPAPAPEPERARLAPVSTAVESERPRAAPAREKRAPERRDVTFVHLKSGTPYRLTRDVDAVVGRRDKATGFVPDIDLTDHDGERTLSRRHLRIIWREGDCFVLEANKTPNGSFVNGHKVETGVPVRLQNGDRVQLGVVELEFRG
jgi:CRP-like cAMP-binding protein